MNKIIKLLIISFCVLLNQGCKKEFLDRKSNKALVVPKTLEEFRALLDNGYDVMNRTSYLTQIADGDFKVSESGIMSLIHESRNAYLWKEDIFEGSVSFEWNKSYEQIFYTNVVLEGLADIDRHMDAKEFDHVKGAALFMRGYALNQVVQQYAVPYDAAMAKGLVGVPIRTSSDVNIKSKRSTLAQSYEQIIRDITESIPLLPEKSERRTRPSKAAAYAMLARVYLTMGEYGLAAEASTSSLNIMDELIDYNRLDTNAISPFPNGRFVYNNEIIYYTDRMSNSFYQLSSVRVHPQLFDQFQVNDLRRVIFFKPSGEFKGSYGGMPNFPFTGLATDEMYLVRAESYARIGRVGDAMADLNTLMKNRWKEGEFTPFMANDEIEALTFILSERRKELMTRGLRWSDLRRLNRDPRFETTLEREYQGETYRLLPNDKRYTFLIPQNEIEGSRIEQNER